MRAALMAFFRHGTVAAVSILAANVAIAACTDYSEFVHWVGNVALPPSSSQFRTDMALGSNHVYVISPSPTGTIHVADTTDPTAPLLIGTITLPESPRSLSIQENTLYAVTENATTREETLHIIDVSDPSSPIPLGSIGPMTLAGFAVIGPYAYCTGGDSLSVVDVSSPAAPAIVGRVSAPGTFSIDVVEDHAYVLSSTTPQFRIFDISSPTAPAPAGSLGIAGSSVAVVPPIAYVGSSSLLRTIDVSNPNAPVPLGTASVVAGARPSVEIVGDVAFLADYTSGVAVIDVSDPASPQVAGALQSCSSAQVIDASASHLYVAAAFGGLHVYSLGNLGTVQRLGSLGMTAQEIAAQGSLAYVATGSTLTIVDLAVPATPQVLGSAAIPAQSVSLAGTYAYVASGTQLRVVDVSEPSLPAVIGSAVISGSCNQVRVSGSHAYVATNTGLAVVDVFDAANPVEVGSLPVGDQLFDLAITGTHVYARDPLDFVHVIDVSDPQLPVERTTLYGRFVQSNASHLFVGGIGLTSFELSDPANPTPVGLGGEASCPVGGRLVDDHLYVTSLTGVEIYDVQDPTAPRFVGNIGFLNAPSDVAVTDGAILVAIGSDTYIIPRHCEVVGTAEWSDPVSGLRLDAWPNPGHGTLHVRYSIPYHGQVELGVFDVAGRRLRTLVSTYASERASTVAWDGKDEAQRRVPAGIYFVRLTSPWGVANRRVALLR